MEYLRGRGIRMPADCALTVGKFEGIHLGHRLLIDRLNKQAHTRGLASAVLTFEPHPRRFLTDASYKPLFTSAERAYILNALDVDFLLEYPFDAECAAMEPRAFCDFIFNALRARLVAVGEGFTFGRGRAGGINTLIGAAGAYGAEVEVLLKLRGNGGHIISTSEIQALVRAGKMEEAASLLGFYFFIAGTVSRGSQIGRALGYPTVNTEPAVEKSLPPNGVYVTRTLFDNQVYGSVTNIGVRPTVQGAEPARRPVVESFLLDYSGDLYGRELITEFIAFLRPEMKFGDMEALRGQIGRDTETARGMLRMLSGGV